jgi:hypothetical protein
MATPGRRRPARRRAEAGRRDRAHVGGEHDRPEARRQRHGRQREQRLAEEGAEREKEARERGVSDAMDHSRAHRYRDDGCHHPADRRASGEEGSGEREDDRHAADDHPDRCRLGLL